MKPGDSALIRIQLGTAAPDLRLQPHPQLLVNMDVSQKLRSISLGGFVHYLLWFDKTHEPPPQKILLHLTTASAASVMIRAVEVELASSP